METSKLERLIYLLHMVAGRADAMTAGGMGLGGSYAAVGKVFNDYVRQARELSSTDMISVLEEMEIPAEGANPEAFLGELALRAVQIASELEFALAAEEEQDEERDSEDTADALVRLREAGVDIDDLVQGLTSIGFPSRLDRRWVDKVCRLAKAGVDVDSLVEDPAFLRADRHRSRHDRHARRFDRLRRQRPGMHRGPHVVTIECTQGLGRARQRHQAGDVERAESPIENRSWQMDILSRVEKGEITPEEAAELLRATQTGDDGEI
jgi:hypothetical protein